MYAIVILPIFDQLKKKNNKKIDTCTRAKDVTDYERESQYNLTLLEYSELRRYLR